jgi:hypothetical protein
MSIICKRKDKFIQNHAELNDNELYCPSHFPDRRFYMNTSDRSLLKRASDKHDFKKEVPNVKTYADYFEDKVPNIRIRRDSFLATMIGIKKPRINYLKETTQTTKEETSDLPKEPVYYPLELLRYAPLNAKDFQLIYKLPSILIRLSQLYRTERLRKLFADNVKSYSVRLVHLNLLTVKPLIMVISTLVESKNVENENEDEDDFYFRKLSFPTLLPFDILTFGQSIESPLR